MRMIRAAHQRTGFDVGKADFQPDLFPFFKFLRSVIPFDFQVLFRRLQILANGDNVHLVIAKILHRFHHFFKGFPHSDHEAGFGRCRCLRHRRTRVASGPAPRDCAGPTAARRRRAGTRAWRRETAAGRGQGARPTGSAARQAARLPANSSRRCMRLDISTRREGWIRPVVTARSASSAPMSCPARSGRGPATSRQNPAITSANQSGVYGWRGRSSESP